MEKDLIQVLPEQSTGFPYFLQFKSTSCSKEEISQGNSTFEAGAYDYKTSTGLGKQTIGGHKQKCV